ncbi:MAG: 4Fe-4S binding protein [Spirochaetia bacterium]
MLRLMLGSMITAVVLQMTGKKRTWCSTVCPYGNSLSAMVTFRNTIT